MKKKNTRYRITSLGSIVDDDRSTSPLINQYRRYRHGAHNSIVSWRRQSHEDRRKPFLLRPAAARGPRRSSPAPGVVVRTTKSVWEVEIFLGPAYAISLVNHVFRNWPDISRRSRIWRSTARTCTAKFPRNPFDVRTVCVDPRIRRNGFFRTSLRRSTSDAFWKEQTVKQTWTRRPAEYGFA